MTWALILTLSLQASEPSAAVAVVQGFDSQSTCMLAGNAWMNQQRDMLPRAKTHGKIAALCVPMGVQNETQRR